MNLISNASLALLHLEPGTQLLGLFFAGWALVMFLVLRMDDNRVR